MREQSRYSGDGIAHEDTGLCEGQYIFWTFKRLYAWLSVFHWEHRVIIKVLHHPHRAPDDDSYDQNRK